MSFFSVSSAFMRGDATASVVTGCAFSALHDRFADTARDIKSAAATRGVTRIRLFMSEGPFRKKLYCRIPVNAFSRMLKKSKPRSNCHSERSSRLFGFLPQPVHLLDRHIVQGFTGCCCALFDVPETANEFADRLSESVFRIDSEEPRDVDKHEKDISQFFFDAGRVFQLEGLLELRHLLVQFGQYLLDTRPVEPHPRGPFLQPVRADEGRQVPGYAFQYGCSLFVPLFFFFDLFPVCEHFPARLQLQIPENMRMAARHLLDSAGNDVPDRKFAFFLGDPRVKDDLKQDVAELFLDLLRRTFVQRLHDLIAFLKKERLEGQTGLLKVPGTAVRTAKLCHQFDQLNDVVSQSSFLPDNHRTLFKVCMHYNIDLFSGQAFSLKAFL